MPANWISRGTVLIQLGRQHFAFYRGYLDGLDLKQLSERYIETDGGASTGDLRLARSLLSWIVDQLTIAARRTGNAASVRLLRMSAETLGVAIGAKPDAGVPDLEEFREQRDPHQMFSERELLALFEEEYGRQTDGAERRARRNRRLRARQIAVINHLETLVQTDPKLEDRVDGWLDPAIARRLVDAGIVTLAQLVRAIEDHGFRWYTKVPRIGVRAAAYISEWLTLPETAQALGVTLSVRSLRARKDLAAAQLPALPRRAGIVPLERFNLPPACSGESACNRGDGASLRASTDLEAIGAWLARKKAGSNTARVYRKEAERLLLWAVLERGKAVSALDTDDCIAYRDFLSGLGRDDATQWHARFRIPQADWIGPRGIDRTSARWRPFEGELSESSRKTALVILHGMMQWLCAQGHLKSNPFKAADRSRSAIRKIAAGRSLKMDEVDAIKGFLDSMQVNQRVQRLRFVLALAFGSGCRLSELAGLRRKDVVRHETDDGTGWQWALHVGSDSGMSRRIPLEPAVADEMDHYFRQRGHRCFLDAPATAPLIASISSGGTMPPTEDALSATRIYQVLKAFFLDVAKATAKTDPEAAARYRSVSTHWLRHSFGVHGVEAGMELERLRELLGHKSRSTTAMYLAPKVGARGRKPS